MFSRLSLVTASAIGLCGLALLGSPSITHAVTLPAGAADDTGAAYKKIADSVGPALVSVKFLMKVEGGRRRPGSEAGRDMEITGLMIESGGLVVVSNAKMGGLASRAGVTANPTNIRILVGDDTEGLKARILARDSELDLCWIQINPPTDDTAKAKTFATVDFGAGVTAAVGERLFVVERLGKFFDHALHVSDGRVGGITHKPRPLMISSGFVGGERDLLGTPMFNADGKVVGLNILQVPDKEDIEGGETSGEGNSGILLLPAAEVVRATARGKEMAAKNPPKEEEKEGDAKVEKKPEGPSGAKTDEPKKP